MDRGLPSKRPSSEGVLMRGMDGISVLLRPWH